MALVPQDVRRANGLDLGADVDALFVRLTNQLGIVLANGELLEAKAIDDTNRMRASLVIASALEAMAITRGLRSVLDQTPQD